MSNAYNPLPITTLPSSPTITEDSSANYIVGISIADADGGNQTVTLTANNGTVSLDTTTGLSGLTGNGSANISFSGSLADINTALASLSFTPSANFAGTATLRVQSNDGVGGTDDDTLNITVSGTNDAPVLTPAAPTLTSISEDDIYNTGQTVASLLGASVSNSQFELKEERAQAVAPLSGPRS